MEEQTQTSTSPEGEKQLLPATPVEGAVEPKEGAGEEGVDKTLETPPKEPEKTRTEEEWKTRQSSWDKGLDELRGQHKEAVKQVQEQLNQRLRADFVSQAEAKGEDAGQAGTLFDLKQQLQEKETGLVELANVLNTAKKDRTADELIEKFTLPKDVRDLLLKAETPTEMTTLAMEMALEATKAKGTPPTKTPSGVGTGKGIDLSKATPRERAEAYFREQAGE